MASEIIFDADRGMEEQMREVLDLADPDSADVGAIHWYPRPNKPHGGVVQVPDHIAERHASALDERRAAQEAEADQADADSESEPDGTGQDRTGSDEEPPPAGQPTVSRRSSRRAAAQANTTDPSEEAGNA
jgi:hypothetical protein